MTVYSKLLAVGHNNGAFAGTVYRTPAGSTSILKRINAINNSAVTVDLYVELPYSSSSRWGGFVLTLPANGLRDVETWIVIPEGWAIGVTWFEAAQVHWWLSGTELVGLPPVPTVPAPGMESFPPPGFAEIPPPREANT